ncbi:uncharacterized protein LOC120011546 [Tripterygium wilfordii]|uniref:uncharacterized protein LOC120011546 n=1 Tax=Tripterygium wilfordii TaxID=458696 RepID=UPI0018F83305|nr:uncharacterized protein LOC120011546 [Tripterygium wilfordii]
MWLGAGILLFYLRLNIKSIVRNCYPTKTERADDWLIKAMLRASYDPGVLVVLESIFSFNLSLPCNFLLKEFKERVLILQAAVPMMSSQNPEEVNLIICEWVMAAESKILAER